MAENKMDKIISLAKRRGFIFPGSEIYGGLANTYDYGPVGTELLRNIRNLWWDTFVHRRTDMVGLEASLISHQDVWKASGHVGGFADALVDCKECKSRIRADHLIEDWLEVHASEFDLGQVHKGLDSLVEGLTNDLVEKVLTLKKVEGLSDKELGELIKQFHINCPNCKENKGDKWTEVRKFNLLFPVHLGIIEGEQSLAYLRGETAQGMFTAFKNIVDSTRVRLPFGVAQNGKSFRNEITPGNSVFRTLVFEQGEIEYFFDPEKSNWEELFESWKKDMWQFVTEKLKIKKENLRWREHTDEERSFYSKRTEDMEYNFPFGGFKELWGLSYRTDYDLARHQEFSKKDLTIIDPYDNKKILPHVIEPAVGIDRLFLMVLSDAFVEEENRIVLKLSPNIAPYKIAVFPLLANKEEIVNKAKDVFNLLLEKFSITFDNRGNIGKRYLYQDEIGTPWCVTIDFETLENDTVTVRDRDSMLQERVKTSELEEYFNNKL